jgi:hypothetical protein
MTNAFTRRLDRLHRQHVVDPENMSEVDLLMLEMREMAREYLERPLSRPDAEAASVDEVRAPPDAETVATTPAIATTSAANVGGGATVPRLGNVPAGTTPTEPPPPPTATVQANPVPWPPPIAVADGRCRWVPRHEADAMRAQDMRDYQRRLAEQEWRRYLGWD